MRSYTEEDLRGLRIGILESDALGAADSETRAAVGQAARFLSAQGFNVEPFRLEALIALWTCGGFSFGRVIGKLIRESVAGQENQISPMLREYLSYANSGSPITLETFIKACADAIFSAPRFSAKCRTRPCCFLQFPRARVSSR